MVVVVPVYVVSFDMQQCRETMGKCLVINGLRRIRLFDLPLCLHGFDFLREHDEVFVVLHAFADGLIVLRIDGSILADGCVSSHGQKNALQEGSGWKTRRPDQNFHANPIR